jgi:oligopeptidase B
MRSPWHLVALTLATAPAAPLGAQTPPVARIIPHTDTLHGDVRVDDYYWLRDKTNPEVIAYLNAENDYTTEKMRHTEALQERLYAEMLGRIKETDQGVPYLDHGYWYYTRTETGKSYPIYCRKQGSLEAPEEIIFDQNARAAGKKFHALGGFDISPDSRYLLLIEDTTAFRQYTLYVKDLAEDRFVDSIQGVWNGTAWADDNRTFFYMTADSAMRGNAVWRHVTGTPRSQDAKVFQEDNVLNNVGVFRTRSGKYIFITADGFTSSEWRYVPTDAPTSLLKVFAPRRPGVEYQVEHADGFFLLYSNEQATNFRVIKVPEDDPSTGWTDWQPTSDSVFIEGVDAFKRFVVVTERARGLRRLRVTDVRSNRSHFITFPEPAYGVFGSTNAEFDTELYRFAYSSMVTPTSVYDYDMATRQRTLKKRLEIPSGFDGSRYRVARFMAPARDGVQVPVSVLMQKGTRLDGTRPLLLYAYGSYGATIEPTFNSNVLSLVDRGFVYVIAHIRGGQELGRKWYDDGKMMRKMNTFNDLMDVARELVRRKYTSTDRLIANGGSAGGLLMGVISNQAPELFRAIVAEVPFVDVINTMSDASLPLTAQEWEQWGNPAIKEQYDYILSYSPYDNVARRNYPWMLVTSSLNDSQVMYFEPTKWVAKLRAIGGSANPLYFRINMGGGHGGPSGRYDRLREVAFKYAFMLDAVGMANATP